MPPALNQPPVPPAAPTRVVAALLAWLVLGLHLLAYAPAAHAWLHRADTHDAAAHQDAACVVSLFAHGITTAPIAPEVVPPRFFIAAASAPAPESPLATTPARLHPPAHAPPPSAARV